MYSFTLETSSIKCIRKGGKSAEIDAFVACYIVTWTSEKGVDPKGILLLRLKSAQN